MSVPGTVGGGLSKTTKVAMMEAVPKLEEPEPLDGEIDEPEKPFEDPSALENEGALDSILSLWEGCFQLLMFPVFLMNELYMVSGLKATD